MKIKRNKLSNGSYLTVLHLEDVVSAYFLILSKSGPRFDPSDKAGLSHFVEHLFCKETEKFPIQNETLKGLEKLGVSTGAFSYQETNMYWSKSFSDDLLLVMDIQIDRFINPIFKKKDIDNEKKIVSEEIQVLNNNPESLIWEEWAKNVWQGSLLGRSYIGNFEERYK